MTDQDQKQDYRLGGGTYGFKLSWNDNVIDFSRKCSYYYALAHVDKNVYAPVFIAWVKSLHAILIPFLDEEYFNIEMGKSKEIINKLYADKRLSKNWKSIYSIQYQIEYNHLKFRNLMKSIKKVGLVQSKNIAVDIGDFNEGDSQTEENVIDI